MSYIEHGAVRMISNSLKKKTTKPFRRAEVCRAMIQERKQEERNFTKKYIFEEEHSKGEAIVAKVYLIRQNDKK